MSNIVRVIVPQRCINGGLDYKFDPDPNVIKSCDVFKGVLLDEEYHDWVVRLNDSIKPARSKKGDMVMLVLAPVPFVLPIWGLRRKSLAKKRKQMMGEVIDHFNAAYQPNLFMQWNRRPISQLTIEVMSESNNDPVSNNLSVVPYSITNSVYPDSHILETPDIMQTNRNSEPLIDLLDVPPSTIVDNNLQTGKTVATSPGMITTNSSAENPFDVYLSNNNM